MDKFMPTPWDFIYLLQKQLLSYLGFDSIVLIACDFTYYIKSIIDRANASLP